jgi:hypothetical protein
MSTHSVTPRWVCRMCECARGVRSATGPIFHLCRVFDVPEEKSLFVYPWTRGMRRAQVLRKAAEVPAVRMNAAERPAVVRCGRVEYVSVCIRRAVCRLAGIVVCPDLLTCIISDLAGGAYNKNLTRAAMITPSQDHLHDPSESSTQPFTVGKSTHEDLSTHCGGQYTPSREKLRWRGEPHDKTPMSTFALCVCVRVCTLYACGI